MVKGYIANSTDSTVTVIDVNNNTVLSTISDVNFSGPYGVGHSFDQKYIVVGNQGNGFISIIDTVTDTVVTSVDLNTSLDETVLPVGVCFSPDNSTIYVSDANNNQIVVIKDLGLGDIITVSIEQIPFGIDCVTRNGTTDIVYVTSSNALSTLIQLNYNTTTDLFTTQIITDPASANGTYGVAASYDNNFVYFTHQDNVISVVDVSVPATPVVLTAITNSINYFGISISNDGTNLFLTDSNSSVQKISSDGLSSTTIFNFGIQPIGVSLTPDNTYVVVANSTPSTSQRFNESVFSASGSPLSTGMQPSAFGKFIIDSPCPPITLTLDTFPCPLLNTPFTTGNLTFSETPDASPFTFVLSSGSLPNGLSIVPGTDPNTQIRIKGIPKVAGNFAFDITVTDTNGCSTIFPFAMSVPNFGECRLSRVATLSQDANVPGLTTFTLTITVSPLNGGAPFAITFDSTTVTLAALQASVNAGLGTNTNNQVIIDTGDSFINASGVRLVFDAFFIRKNCKTPEVITATFELDYSDTVNTFSFTDPFSCCDCRKKITHNVVGVPLPQPDQFCIPSESEICYRKKPCPPVRFYNGIKYVLVGEDANGKCCYRIQKQ